MHALETELDAAHQRAPNSQPRGAESRPAQAEAEDLAQPFSPDPMCHTDRYRLVTPYRLSDLD